jgi:ribosomal protection tetracycline resistance protein
LKQGTLNLGILAHVDAGKTTLTERLLFAAGVIDEIGSVDAGTTQTDSLDIERQRGITIKSAVVAFAIGGVSVNLIDTPGHPDFVAEVDRALGVLDGAVLVISAVEGVQPQTRILMRALQRLHVPTLVFVNKIDRAGADERRVLDAIARRLTPAVVPLGAVAGIGTRAARFLPDDPSDPEVATRLCLALAEADGSLLAELVAGTPALPYRRLHERLAEQTGRAAVHPLYFGSALTGAGIDELMQGIANLLPAAAGDTAAPVSGRVFKIDRAAGGSKVAYVRLFAGTVRVRDHLRFGHAGEGKVTDIAVFVAGGASRRPSLAAGGIGKLSGLREIRIGDWIGVEPEGTDRERHFAPPTLATVVVPDDPAERTRLRAALEQLAEQDPLIDVRLDDDGHEISVSLYGEVQEEVIQATLAADFGLSVSFREVTPLYAERPAGPGEWIERLHGERNPFNATIGLRVEPGPAAGGIVVRLAVDPRTLPLYLFRTPSGFSEHFEGVVRSTLREGLLGWQVTDCLVTVTECHYSVADGPPSRRGPTSTAADFRNLTPIVLMEALACAGTVVCEPVMRVHLEVPPAAGAAVGAALGRAGAAVEASSTLGE